MMKTLTNIYQTSDLYLAAYLKAKGLRFLDKKRSGNRFVFIFDDREDIKEVIQDYFNDGLVGITVFKNAIQDLKTIMYSPT